MKTNRILLLVIFVQLVVFVSASFSADKPSDAVTDQTRCTVCGMFVSKYPNWLAQIQYEDAGQTNFFDGVKDMMAFYFNPEQYGGCPGKMLFMWLAVMFTVPWDTNSSPLQQERRRNHSAKIITARRSSSLMRLPRSSLSRCAWDRKCDEQTLLPAVRSRNPSPFLRILSCGLAGFS